MKGIEERVFAHMEYIMTTILEEQLALLKENEEILKLCVYTKDSDENN